MEQNIFFMQKEIYFRKCSFCNIFEISSPDSSGDVLHAHDYTQIWYVTRGKCEHYVEGQLNIVNAGDAFLIQPQMNHQTILCRDSSAISCDVALEDIFPPKNAGTEPNSLSSILNMMSMTVFFQDSKSRQPRFTFHSGTKMQIDRLFHELLHEYQQELPCYADMLRIKIQELLLLFVREFVSSPEYQDADATYQRYNSSINTAIRYIDEHFSEALSLEDACRLSMMSRTYFCYLFKLITKQTFVEYLTERRIAEAMRLLEHSSLSVLDISQSTGFNDVTHFSRTFKKQTGMSPSNYRKIRWSPC